MIKEIKDLAEKSAVPKLSGKLNDQSNPGVLWTGGVTSQEGKGAWHGACPLLLILVCSSLSTQA